MNRRIFFAACVLALTGNAFAAGQQDNLRGLTAADLCPPTAFVYVDDDEQEDIAMKLDEALDKYSTLYSIPYGDPKTCTVNQTFVVDSFKSESNSRYVYAVEFSLELKNDTKINLPLPMGKGTNNTERTLSVKYVQFWNDRGYGTVANVKSVPDMSVEQVRDYYEAFALAWKATHKK